MPVFMHKVQGSEVIGADVLKFGCLAVFRHNTQEGLLEVHRPRGCCSLAAPVLVSPL